MALTPLTLSGWETVLPPGKILVSHIDTDQDFITDSDPGPDYLILKSNNPAIPVRTAQDVLRTRSGRARMRQRDLYVENQFAQKYPDWPAGHGEIGASSYGSRLNHARYVWWRRRRRAGTVIRRVVTAGRSSWKRGYGKRKAFFGLTPVACLVAAGAVFVYFKFITKQFYGI
jgi:hypothetical protein